MLLALIGCGDAAISGSGLGGSAFGAGGDALGSGGAGGFFEGNGGSPGSGGAAGQVGGTGGEAGAGGNTGGTCGVAPSGTNAERRCDELGANCVCSEPLAATGQDFVGQHNPPDSTTKQCADGPTWDSNSGARSVTPPNLPNGAAVNSVYELKYQNGGIHHVLGNTPVRAGSKRICIRQYHFLSSNFPQAVTSSCTRIKSQEISGRNMLVQTTWGSTRNMVSGILKDANGNLITDKSLSLRSGTSLSQDDVLGRWYTTETCVSGDLGVASGTVRSIESRMRIPDTGQEEVRYLPGVPFSGVDTRIDTVWIGNLFTQGNCSPGRRYAAYSMQAEWDTDEGQWIGPAAEMEGHSDSCPR